MSTETIPFEAPDPEELAALFPGYSVHSLIACGGMGAVYHARQIALDREVAIKILPREFSSDEAFREAFAAEAKAMAKLNHPNLISVYDFGEADGMLFIIMEFVAGQSLYHAAYQMAVEPREAARLVSEICSGIAEAHQHGILHRDIKPANVLLDAHARPKIGDFGLARPIGTAAKVGEVIFGTPHYTAPEVVNSPARVDARADVFSLGVVLHELLTGKLPAADPRPPSAISGCSPKFDPIVKRATQEVPELRYPDAASMARDLAALATVPASAPRAGAGVVRPPTVRRPRAKKASAMRKSDNFRWGTILLLLLLAAAGYHFYKKSEKPVPAPAPAEKPVVSGETPELPSYLPTTPDAPAPRANLPGPFGEVPEGPVSSAGDNQFGTPVEPVPEIERPKPIFKVDQFLTRARGIMKTKTSDLRVRRDRALGENIVQFDREVSRNARKDGSAAVTATAEAMKALRTVGNRIPDDFKIPRLSDSAFSEAFADALKRQEAADEDYTEALKTHADAYVVGINLQVERLLPTNDPGAIQLLKEEIDATESDADYFSSVIEK